MVAGRLQEKNGFYYIVLSYTDSAGKRRQPWIGTGLPVKGNKNAPKKCWRIRERISRFPRVRCPNSAPTWHSATICGTG